MNIKKAGLAVGGCLVAVLCFLGRGIDRLGSLCSIFGAEAVELPQKALKTYDKIGMKGLWATESSQADRREANAEIADAHGAGTKKDTSTPAATPQKFEQKSRKHSNKKLPSAEPTSRELAQNQVKEKRRSVAKKKESVAMAATDVRNIELASQRPQLPAWTQESAGGGIPVPFQGARVSPAPSPQVAVAPAPQPLPVPAPRVAVSHVSKDLRQFLQDTALPDEPAGGLSPSQQYQAFRYFEEGLPLFKHAVLDYKHYVSGPSGYASATVAEARKSIRQFLALYDKHAPYLGGYASSNDLVEKYAIYINVGRRIAAGE